MTVTLVQQTCEACPSQWDAVTDDGESVYIRYRCGHLTVEVGGCGGVLLFGSECGDGLDGYMDEDQLKEQFAIEGHVLNLGS